MSPSSIAFYANFWPQRQGLQSIEEQYADLWRFAKALESIGIPLSEWSPPADTPASSLLNPSFDAKGVTVAALAMAKADTGNHKPDFRSLGAWNGIEGPGGMVFTTLLSTGSAPCNVNFSAKKVAALTTYANALAVVRAMLDIWLPTMVLVGPRAYESKAVFHDRPPVSWMLYLPLKIETHHAPEAAELHPILNADNKQKGTLIVSTTEVFDAKNPQHVKRANDLEVRLADQDLLPRYVDFMNLR